MHQRSWVHILPVVSLTPYHKSNFSVIFGFGFKNESNSKVQRKSQKLRPKSFKAFCQGLLVCITIS